MNRNDRIALLVCHCFPFTFLFLEHDGSKQDSGVSAFKNIYVTLSERMKSLSAQEGGNEYSLEFEVGPELPTMAYLQNMDPLFNIVTSSNSLLIRLYSYLYHCAVTLSLLSSQASLYIFILMITPFKFL